MAQIRSALVHVAVLRQSSKIRQQGTLFRYLKRFSGVEITYATIVFEAVICYLAPLTRPSVQLHNRPNVSLSAHDHSTVCLPFRKIWVSPSWVMLLWRVQRAAGAVASRCGGRLAHIRAMATVPGSSSAVKQGKHTINDTEFIAYRYTAPTAADKPCVVFLHGKPAQCGTGDKHTYHVCTRCMHDISSRPAQFWSQNKVTST